METKSYGLHILLLLAIVYNLLAIGFLAVGVVAMIIVMEMWKSCDNVCACTL